MYEDFTASDPISGENYDCQYQSVIVGIATRHSDTVDIKFLVNGQPVWLGLPHPFWVEFRRRTGKALSDRMAVDLAGMFLKRQLESGSGAGRNYWNEIRTEDVIHLAGELGWLTVDARS